MFLFQMHRDSRRDDTFQSTHLRPSDDRTVSEGAIGQHNGVQRLLAREEYKNKTVYLGLNDFCTY